MAKTKIKTINLSNKNKAINVINNQQNDIFIFVIKLLINTIVIMLASKLFKNLNVDGFFYAMLTALLISVLNQFIKPYLKIITLPLSIITFGLFYPFINVIILKLASLLMGTHFEIEGIFIPLIISMFISFMNYVFENLILGNSRRNY